MPGFELFRTLKGLTGFSGEARHGPPRSGELFHIHLDASKAARELRWEPTVSLEEGLRRTVKSFQERLRRWS